MSNQEVTEQTAAQGISPTAHIDSHIGIKGKDYVQCIDYGEFVFPSDEEYANQQVTTPVEKVFVKDVKPEPKMVGRKGEKTQALDEDGQPVFSNKAYAKSVGIYTYKDTLLTWLEEHGLNIMLGKMIHPLVAAGRNKNIKNPVPDNYVFSEGQIRAFYDGQTIEDVLKSLLFQGWAPPTSRLTTAAAIAAACPIEWDDDVESRYFSYVAERFEGAKADTFGVGTAAGFKSLVTFIGKKCQTPRLPKSTYLNDGITVLNQLSSKYENEKHALTTALQQGKFEEGTTQHAQVIELLDSRSDRILVFNHVLCALNEAHKQALRKEAAAAAKKSKTDRVAQSEPDLVSALLAGEDISDLLEGQVDLIPDLEDDGLEDAGLEDDGLEDADVEGTDPTEGV